MKCPYCGSSNTHCTDSRPVAKMRRRKYRCNSCSGSFGTVEKISSDSMKIKENVGKNGMSETEAREKAEEIVFVDYTAPDIIYACEQRGIRTQTKSGRYRSRSALETALIEAMTEEFMIKR